MLSFVFWSLIFSVSTAAAIALIGDRSLISGNLFKLENFIKMVFHWKFILSMLFAVFARLSFILMNNSLLKIPNLSGNSTTITALVSAVAFIFVIIANYFFLSEKLSLQQGLGAALIMVGIFIILG